MTIIIADYIYTPEGYIQDKAIAFDATIKSIDDAHILLEQFRDATIIRTKPYSIVYPGLINTHIHLEFSSNKTTLKYGSFMPWLESVIEHRDEIIETSDNESMMAACDEMLHSGITSFGAVSSYGGDLEVCQKAPQRVTYYNELIGSSAATADVLYGDFMQRVSMSEQDAKKHNITPAIAVHSPYSVHPVLLQKAVSLAKKKSYPLSAHLLESVAEKQWLEQNNGEFAKFFNEYFNATKAVTTPDEFIAQFDTYPTHFIHCTQTSREQREHLVSKHHTIAHCPRSNRLLGSDRLPIEELENAVMSIATDGNSSNYSLNIWDELRAALFMHNNVPLVKMADRFMRSVTLDAARAMGLNAGKLEVGAVADIIVTHLPQRPCSTDDISLQAILHTKGVDNLYINGKEII